MRIAPTLDLERAILAAGPAGTVLGGVDEVGRGPLAGPVSVGIAVIRAGFDRPVPVGLADSKALTSLRRDAIVEEVRAWPEDVAVGHASSAIVDEVGIVGALRRAAANALEKLAARGNAPTQILLDGSHDWWSAASLFETAPLLPALPVQMQVKADALAALVSAASVVAKVERDSIMEGIDAAFPGYHWAENKGYGTRAHIEALDRLGPSTQHRVSWHLPTLRSE